MSFYLVWSQNNRMLRGFDTQASSWVDGQLTYPVAFPGSYSQTEIVTLRSSAREANTLEVLKNVRLYLTGDPGDIQQVQRVWPALGDTFQPPRPEANGGLEISFDQGRTYTRFNQAVGLESDPLTWLLVDAASIGLGASDGQIGPFDEATFFVRYKIPALATHYKLLDIRLAAGFDIV